MKKSSKLDTKGFLLVETLLVSLTIASILLYMYVQYSKIADSYKRLNRYNTVEALYRTGTIKQILLTNASSSFYSTLSDKCEKVTNSVAGVSGINFNSIISDFSIESLYIAGPGCDIYTNSGLKNDGFSAFLNTVPEVENDKYQIIVHYKEDANDVGEFAIISFKEPSDGE